MTRPTELLLETHRGASRRIETHRGAYSKRRKKETKDRRFLSPSEGSDENLVSRTYAFTLFAFIRLSIYPLLPFEGGRALVSANFYSRMRLSRSSNPARILIFPLRQGGFIKILVFVNTRYIFGIRCRGCTSTRTRYT